MKVREQLRDFDPRLAERLDHYDATMLGAKVVLCCAVVVFILGAACVVLLAIMKHAG